MTLLPPGMKVHLALGYTDMRKGLQTKGTISSSPVLNGLHHVYARMN